jgi:Na+/proline symporter
MLRRITGMSRTASVQRITRVLVVFFQSFRISASLVLSPSAYCARLVGWCVFGICCCCCLLVPVMGGTYRWARGRICGACGRLPRSMRRLISIRALPNALFMRAIVVGLVSWTLQTIFKHTILSHVYLPGPVGPCAEMNADAGQMPAAAAEVAPF